MLGLASEGDVFLHGVRATSGSMLAWVEMRGAVTLDDIAAWARGVSQDQALQRWHQGIEAIMQAESRHGADDEAFWQQAPQLAGDWPEYWRRGSCTTSRHCG